MDRKTLITNIFAEKIPSDLRDAIVSSDTSSKRTIVAMVGLTIF